jgi:Na+/citrate or Na+/malate symporter
MLLAATSIVLSLLFFSISCYFGKKNPGKSSHFTGGAIIVLLIAPLFCFIPKVEVEWSVFQSSHVVTEQAGFSWLQLLLFIWAFGTLVLLGRLLSHFISVRRWRLGYDPVALNLFRNQLTCCCWISLPANSPP